MSCWLNAIVQCLYHRPPLQKDLSDPAATKGPLGRLLRELFHKMSSKQWDYVAPFALLNPEDLWQLEIQCLRTELNKSIGLSSFCWWTSTTIEVHHQKLDFVIDPAAGNTMLAAKVDH